MPLAVVDLLALRVHVENVITALQKAKLRIERERVNKHASQTFTSHTRQSFTSIGEEQQSLLKPGKWMNTSSLLQNLEATLDNNVATAEPTLSGGQAQMKTEQKPRAFA